MRASYAFVLQKNNVEVSTYSVLTPTFIIEPLFTYFFNVKRYICDIMKERNSREKDVFLCLAPSRRAFAGLKKSALVRSCNGECGKAWSEKVAI